VLVRTLRTNYGQSQEHTDGADTIYVTYENKPLTYENKSLVF
jgi:hypothetical protein